MKIVGCIEQNWLKFGTQEDKRSTYMGYTFGCQYIGHICWTLSDQGHFFLQMSKIRVYTAARQLQVHGCYNLTYLFGKWPRRTSRYCTWTSCYVLLSFVSTINMPLYVPKKDWLIDKIWLLRSDKAVSCLWSCVVCLDKRKTWSFDLAVNKYMHYIQCMGPQKLFKEAWKCVCRKWPSTQCLVILYGLWK